MENKENHFDAIFIGSGIGSLTTASLLAQFKDSRVLILEKHFEPGGFTHEFKRKQGKYSWDVGIHYIGDMGEGSFTRKVFDKITNNNLKWERMNDPFEKFVYPGIEFAVYGDPEKYKSDLISLFPEEESSILKYFKDVRKASVFFGRHMMLKLAPPMLESLIDLFDSEKPIYTLKDYLDSHFKDERLKSILASQWGDYGLPPSQASFAIHALVVQHYLNGGFYPVGGAGEIFKHILPILEEKGGKVLISHQVETILIEDGKAVGVSVKKLRGRDEIKETFYAPIIVSCAGAYSTYMKLVPDTYSIPFRSELQKFYDKFPKVTNVTLYIAFKESPASLGFKGENHWIFSNLDHDKNFDSRNDWLGESDLSGAYLSFPSLKNPKAVTHTADIIAFIDYEPFAKWRDFPWKKRGKDYNELKERIAQKLIQYIDKHYPGFKDLIDFYELSTPLTNENFTGHPNGMIYGLPCVPERFDRQKCPWFEIKTPIEGLYLTGVDVSSPGVSGAMMGGMILSLLLMNGIDIIKMISKG
jgi:phytoene dehydrogenase-like protein